MRAKYWCEKCGEDFSNRDKCLDHEKKCNPIVIFKCDKCGKTIKYSKNKNEYYSKQMKNRCWSIDLGRAGYGSRLDGSDIDFDLCDDCLIEIINSFTPEGIEKIKNSGSNTYYEDEWEDDDID